jgi:PIN domain nuclease of toxin-antitoxin system
LGFSAITLIEIVLIPGYQLRSSARELLAALESNSDFQMIPLDIDVAGEFASMGDSLVDPADRIIVATARIHRLRLVTSDQRIINSNLVRVVT